MREINDNKVKTIEIFLPPELRPTCIHNNLRLGSNHDGGYEINIAAVKNSDFLLSFGLSENWTFEEDFLRINPVPLHVYDHTVTRVWLIKNLVTNCIKLLVGKSRIKKLRVSLRALFTYDFFFRKNQVTHHLKKIVGESMNSSEVNFLDTLEKTSSNSIFLKIDIEGSEYRILDQILESKDRLAALAIEFHDLDLLSNYFLNFINEIKNEFQINSININNYAAFPPTNFPEVLEICMSKCSEEGLHQLNSKTEFLSTPNNDLGPIYLVKFADLK